MDPLQPPSLPSPEAVDPATLIGRPRFTGPRPALRVAITGAAGQLAYALYAPLLRGDIFGPDQPIFLHLLDVPAAMDTLKGVVLELEDCAFPLLRGILATDLVKICFQDADVVFLLGSVPRRPGQTLRDLIHANAKTFREQGEALEQHAKKTVRILVVGHPCNTNAMICRQYAPSIPASNFTALTRLYQLRAQFQVAKRLSEATRGAGAANAEDGIWPVHAADVKNVVTWANHSATVYPDLTRAVWTPPGAAEPMPLPEAVASADAALIQVLRNRGTAILEARKVSTGFSGAAAVVQHMRDWWSGTPPGEIRVMGVASDGSYGVPEGLILSFPVTCAGDGTYRIVPDIPLSFEAKTALSAAVRDLQSELEEALDYLRIVN